MTISAETALPIACPLCGAAGHSHFYQTVVRNELRWSISTACPSLGHREEDGSGGGPDDLRNALLAAGGTWSIRVNSSDKVRPLQILKRALNLSNKDILTYLTLFPMFTVGTKTEAEWLESILADEGIGAEKLFSSHDYPAA